MSSSAHASTAPTDWADWLRHSLIKASSIVEVEQHYLVGGNLDPSSVVVDLGANRGHFTRDIRLRFGCRVVAVEPEAKNFAALPDDPNVTKIQTAIGGKTGFILLHVSADSTAHSTEPWETHPTPAAAQKVRLMDFTALAKETGVSRIDLLKVDIEGCEWDFFDAMSDAQLTQIGQITVEFHDFVAAYRDRVRTWPVYQRLMRLGFRCIEDPLLRSYNVLFVNRGFRTKRFSDAVRVTVLDWLLRAQWKFGRLQRLLKKA
jgi:FkbM family methyltransferase